MNQDFLSIFKNINLSSIMGGANKTLGVIKKTIPVYREVKPYLLKEKSIFSKKKVTDVIDEIKELTKRVTSTNEILNLLAIIIPSIAAIEPLTIPHISPITSLQILAIVLEFFIK